MSFGQGIAMMLEHGSTGPSDRRLPGKYPVVAVRADADVLAGPKLASDLATVASSPAILDLSDVPLIDASALTELVRYAKRIAPERAVITGACPFVRRVLTMVEFDKIFILERRSAPR